MCWYAGSADQASDIKLTPSSLSHWHQMNYVDYIHQRFLPFVATSDIESVDDILRLYGVSSSTAATTITPELCVTSVVSDLRATCPLDEMVRVAAGYSQSPVYRFQVKIKSEISCNFYSVPHPKPRGALQCKSSGNSKIELQINWNSDILHLS